MLVWLQRTKEEGAADGEHLKRMFARQRAKDLAEHAKNMLSKDREIEELRRKCQELADQLSNGDVMAPEVRGHCLVCVCVCVCVCGVCVCVLCVCVCFVCVCV